MPYTFSQHVPWWQEIANQVVDLSGNPIAGTIPAGSSVITGSTSSGLHAITSGSFGPAPVNFTGNYTVNIAITITTTGAIIIDSLADPVTAIGVVSDPESVISIPSELDGALAYGDVMDVTSTAAVVPNISSVVDPVLAYADTRDVTSTAAAVPNISSTVDPVLAFADTRDAAVTYRLDGVSNISAAYSTRRLLSSYTGNLIRIRRSSDNTEQNIGFTSAGNLDIGAISSFVGSNSAFIVTWYDQSGNGLNLAQTSTSSQPRIVNTGTLQSIEFDGSNDWLEVANNTALQFGTGSFTAELFINPDNLTPNKQFISKYSNDSTGEWRILLTTGPTIGLTQWNSSGVDKSMNGGTPTTSTWQHVAYTGDGTTTRLFLNGTQVDSETSNLRTSTNALVVGRNPDAGGVWYFDGKIDEIVLLKGNQLYTGSFTAPSRSFY